MSFEFTQARLNFFTFAFCALAPISLVGSGLVMTTIGRARRQGTRMTPYHRLMFGMSVFDAIFSAALAFGPLPIPSGQTPSRGAHGTQASCTAQGFFIVLGYGSICYSMMLSFFYVLVITFNVRDAVIARRFEPFMHAVPISYYIAGAVTGAALDLLNPRVVHCGIGAYPYECTDSADSRCTRGSYEAERVYRLTFSTVPFLTYMFLIWVCLLVVIATVFRKHLKRQRFAFQYRSGSSGFAPPLREGGLTASERRLRQVTVQSLLYASWFSAFVLFGVLDNLLFLMKREYKSGVASLSLLSIGAIVVPSLGTMNFFIFIRPAYVGFRRQFPEKGRWFAIREAVWFPGENPEQRRRRSSHIHLHRESSSSGQQNGSSWFTWSSTFLRRESGAARTGCISAISPNDSTAISAAAVAAAFADKMDEAEEGECECAEAETTCNCAPVTKPETGELVAAADSNGGGSPREETSTQKLEAVVLGDPENEGNIEQGGQGNEMEATSRSLAPVSESSTGEMESHCNENDDGGVRSG